MSASTTGQSEISAAHMRAIAHTARKAFGPGPIDLWSLACTTPAKSKERRRAPRFAANLVNGQVVHDHDVAPLEYRNQTTFAVRFYDQFGRLRHRRCRDLADFVAERSLVSAVPELSSFCIIVSVCCSCGAVARRNQISVVIVRIRRCRGAVPYLSDCVGVGVARAGVRAGRNASGQIHRAIVL
jgi:hypothetical protein